MKEVTTYCFLQSGALLLLLMNVVEGRRLLVNDWSVWEHDSHREGGIGQW